MPSIITFHPENRNVYTNTGWTLPGQNFSVHFNVNGLLSRFKFPVTYPQQKLLTALDAKKAKLAQIVNVDLALVAEVQEQELDNAKEVITKKGDSFSRFMPDMRGVFYARKLPRSLMPKNYQMLGLVYQAVNGKKNNHGLTFKSSTLKLIGTLFDAPAIRATELNTAGSLLTNGSAANNARDNVHHEAKDNSANINVHIEPEDNLIGATVHPESSQLEVEPILKTYAEHVQMYEKLLANEQNPVLKALYKQAIRINQRADSSLLWGTYACLFKQAGAFNFKDKADSVNDSLKQLGDVSEVLVKEAMKNSEHPLTKALHLSTVRVVKETTSEKAINDAINLSALSIQL